MGVGIDLLGKHVRCPHCKQVVLAPAVGGPAPPPAAPVAPPAPPPPPRPDVPPATQVMSGPVAPLPTPEPEAPAPVFNLPREKADSILSPDEGPDDDVFGSHGSNKLRGPMMPEAPAPAPPAAPVAPQPVPVPAAFGPDPASPFAFDTTAPAAPPPPPARAPTPAPTPPGLTATTVLANPFGDLGAAPAPAPAPVAPPPAPPQPAPVHRAPAPPPPTPAVPSNPWAAMESAAPVPAPLPAPAAYPTPVPVPAPQPVFVPQPVAVPAPVQAEEVVDQPEEKPAKKSVRPPVRGRQAATGGVPAAVVYVLGAYALLATVAAVYGLFFNSVEKLDSGHPLSTIPDNFGEFDAVSRKKVSMYKFPVDGELPGNLKARLGGKIEVGMLEVEPVGVEKRRLTMVLEGKGEKKTTHPNGDALVLKLRVKNASSDLAVHPLDPAFTRMVKGDDKPATRLIVASQPFTGGPYPWPFPTGVRQYEKSQEADATPLKPGETREYFVLSPLNPGLITAVRNAGDKPVLWRVEVRRGLVEYRGKERPVNAIVGVEFKPSEIEGL